MMLIHNETDSEVEREETIADDDDVAKLELTEINQMA